MPEASPPDMTFLQFLRGLVVEAQVQLGIIPHPATGQRAVNLAYAKATVRILEQLRDKTKGNLTPEEEYFFRGALTGLAALLAKAEAPSGAAGAPAPPPA